MSPKYETAYQRSLFVATVIRTTTCHRCGAPRGEDCHTATDKGETGTPWIDPATLPAWVHHPRELQEPEIA